MKKYSLLLAFFFAIGFQQSFSQSYSVRTNIIGISTTNLNIEGSIAIDRKWSIHLPIQYNPFVFKNNKQFRNFYFSPGVRYWFLESYIGPYIGIYGTVAQYSVGNLFGNRYRYEGDAYGFGLSIGRAYQLSNKWNMEWELGYGLSRLNYTKYVCKECGDRLYDYKGWKFIPTRVALNFVYLF